MGLDFSHCETHWAYSAFHRFRQSLAKEIGIPDLNEMQGFGFGTAWSPWGTLPWSSFDDDPIVLLLNHPDDCGELSPEECRLVAPRLRELVSSWPRAIPPERLRVRTHYRHGNVRWRAEEMVRGMELAASQNEPFKFW